MAKIIGSKESNVYKTRYIPFDRQGQFHDIFSRIFFSIIHMEWMLMLDRTGDIAASQSNYSIMARNVREETKSGPPTSGVMKLA